ncbi:MAG: GNAT family N-acetyltransferase [Syntrophothermus sp.]
MKIEIAGYHPGLENKVVELWNITLGRDFPLTARLFRQNTLENPNFRMTDGFVAEVDGKPAGFALARICREPIGNLGIMEGGGWISAILVHPDFQHRGVGTALYKKAEDYLAGLGVRTIMAGQDVGHFFAGIPASCLGAMEFFQGKGYEIGREVFDLTRDLGDYQTPPETARKIEKLAGRFVIKNCSDSEKGLLLDFFSRNFPGRWWYEAENYLKRGLPPEDYLIARRAGEVVGFCRVNHQGSKIIGPNIYWSELLGENYAGLGPIGVAGEYRGEGLGMALLCAGLEYLHRLGARRTVIDWTGLVDFYGKVGFKIWKGYFAASKQL